jgi:hypothetical protein
LATILIGILVSLLLFAFAAAFSAGGHNFLLLTIFFPWAMLLTALSPQLPWWPTVFALFALEGSAYGLILGSVQRRRFAFWTTVSLILLVHVLGVVFCFVFDVKESWRILFR